MAGGVATPELTVEPSIPPVHASTNIFTAFHLRHICTIRNANGSHFHRGMRNDKS